MAKETYKEPKYLLTAREIAELIHEFKSEFGKPRQVYQTEIKVTKLINTSESLDIKKIVE